MNSFKYVLLSSVFFLPSVSSAQVTAPTVTGNAGCIVTDTNNGYIGPGDINHSSKDAVCDSNNSGRTDNMIHGNWVDANDLNNALSDMANQVNNIVNNLPGGYDDTALVDRVTNVEGDIANINNAVTNINNTVTNINNAVTNIDNRVTNLETDVTNINNWIDNVNNGGGIKYFHTNSTLADSQANGMNSVAIGPEAIANGEDSVAMGRSSYADGKGAMAVGAESMATGDYASANGYNSQATGVGATATGSNATASADDATASGYSSLASGVGASATGSYATASAYSATASGYSSLASGIGASATGSYATASADGATASGYLSLASGVNSTALGSGSQAQAANSVALGAGSVADRANTVSVGSQGRERQITNVADGSYDTDAVNVRQLRTVEHNSYSYSNYVANQAETNANNYTDYRINGLRQEFGQDIAEIRNEARAGAALSMAMAGLRYDDRPGKGSIAGALGGFKDQTGMAVGFGYTHPNSRLRVNISGSVSPSRGDFGWTAGASWTLN